MNLGFTKKEKALFNKELKGLFDKVKKDISLSALINYGYSQNNLELFKKLLKENITAKINILDSDNHRCTIVNSKNYYFSFLYNNAMYNVDIYDDYSGKRIYNLRLSRKSAIEKYRTDYAIIKKDGKKVLIKILDGDREVIPVKFYIKNKLKKEEITEEEILLLFKLGDSLENGKNSMSLGFSTKEKSSC